MRRAGRAAGGDQKGIIMSERLHDYKLPWAAEKIETRMFGCRVLDAAGKEILNQDAPCWSSKQVTRQDNESGLGFSHNARFNGDTTQEEAAAYVANQFSLFQLFAAAPRMRWMLAQVLDQLPAKRDWLDPPLEAEMRAVVKELA